MRAPLVLLAGVAAVIVATAAATTPTCPRGWILYDDANGSEGGASCLKYTTKAVKSSRATRICPTGSHLLSIASSNSYEEGGLLRFALSNGGFVGCDASVPGNCPVYWIGARLAAVGGRGGPLTWQWTDKFTPDVNLNAAAGLWGTWDDPTDDSAGGTDGDGANDIVYPM